MDFSKLDPQWVLGQGIAVFVCVVLCGLVMLMMRVIVRELRAMRDAQIETTGKLIGAIRWLGEQVRVALKLPPPGSPDEGFHAHRRKNDTPVAPGRKPTSPTPTPSPHPIAPEELDKDHFNFGE